MAVPTLAILREPLSVEGLAAEMESTLRAVDEGCGAICSFVGIVRATHQGRRVRYLEYEAFEPLALRSFEVIRAETAAEWRQARLAIHHRIGRLQIGDASVAIVAAAAHRNEAFQVCRYAIERVKQIAPVWKHEFFEDGETWVEGALANPSDVDARRRARMLACG